MALLPSTAVAGVKENAPPQGQLKTYQLRGNPRAADISPDEKVAAIQITRSEPENDPLRIRVVELAQLWDFRQDRLVAEVRLDAVVADRGHVPRDPFTPRFARFTADGQLVVVYLHHRLHVLDGTDLHELRCIEMNGPPEVTRSYKAKSGSQSYAETTTLRLLEISPIEHNLAVVWTRGLGGFAQVDVLDLDSGQLAGEWNLRDHGVGVWQPKALAWEPSGRELVLAVPNATPCNSPGSEPDIYLVDALTGAIRKQWTSGLLVGDIAVTPDARVWAVDYDCIGVFKDHNPTMRVFDLRTGKRLKETSGRGSGVRYAVSASHKGDRVAAYTGKMKVQFDWLDMVPWGVLVDRTFSVWNSKNGYGLVTSQDLASPRYDWEGATLPLSFRISSGGNLVLYGTTVYELP